MYAPMRISRTFVGSLTLSPRASYRNLAPVDEMGRASSSTGTYLCEVGGNEVLRGFDQGVPTGGVAIEATGASYGLCLRS